MRLDAVLLRCGYIASAVVAILAYLLGLGLTGSVLTFVVVVGMTRLCIYLYFERYLAFRTFEVFKDGKVRHQCLACGASCHLRVNLGKDDMDRVLEYAKRRGMTETIIEHRGSHNWLKRQSNGACVFLKYEGNLPRCSIYEIRPVACRLYPLIPSGSRLKVDPLCPGLSRTEGHTFKEHLATQNVGPYVRKVVGKI